MPRIRKFIDGFCSGAIWLALRLHGILIGPLPRHDENAGGRVAQFIQFVLHYPSLFARLAVAAAAWCIFWLLGWPVLAKFALFAFEIYASLLLIRFFASASRLGQLGKVLAAMWLPIGVTAAAVYLLFVNDQGRELGVGLMDPNERGLFLGLALVYWALNNWLSARIGLDRSFRTPQKDQVLLFWGPRLLGVTAHLLAAVSLSFAASSQPEMQDGIEWLLVPAAPVAIVLATIFAWLLDKGCVSKRYRRDEQSVTHLLMYAVGVVEFLVLSGLVVAWLFDVQPGFSTATLSITFSALFFLIAISVLRNKAPLGEEATREVREADREFEQNVTTFSTLTLAAVMLAVGAAVWNWPMQIGQAFGSLTIACFCFGAFLALSNLVDLLTSRVARYARSAGFDVAPAAIAAVLLCIFVLPAIWASFTHAFHRVRLCDTGCTAAAGGKGWAAVAGPAERATVSEAARAWYAQAERAYHSVRPKDEPVPLLIVATAGGGIRAAYWTATILEKLEADLSRESAGQPDKKPENLLRNLLFAISGVSGGSVGAAAYAASVHDHEINKTKVRPISYLREDFLAPGLAAMAFIDGPANVLPDFGQIDRGEALELGFEYASRTANDKKGLLSHKFLSFFPAINPDTVLHSWRPALLFNATHLETGRRIITSHLKIERDIFVDSYDALQVLNSDVRLSTAAHNSARFTYVSPAGNLQSATTPPHNRGYVIDGGYFENYGAQTALELARKAIEAIDPDHGKPGHLNKVKLVILQISSDPTLKEDRTLVRARPRGDGCAISSFGPTAAKPNSKDQANYLNLIDAKGWSKNEGERYVFSSANELSAPLVGIMTVRQSHGTVAAAELAAAICQGGRKVEVALQNAMKRQATADASGGVPTAASSGNGSPQFVHMAMCEVSRNGKPGISPPLGWVLSDRTRSKFSRILDDCGNRDELVALENALGLSLPTPSSDTTSAVKDPAR